MSHTNCPINSARAHQTFAIPPNCPFRFLPSSSRYNLQPSQPLHAFSQFEEDLAASSQRITPTINKYRKAAILTICFEGDDTHSTSLTKELGETFHRLYNYESTSYIIPTSLPRDLVTRKVREKILHFKVELGSQSDEKHLLIYYFTCSCRDGVSSQHTSGKPIVEWAAVAAAINAKCSFDDVLILMDICHASDLAFHTDNGEMIGATAAGLTSPSNVSSFTQALIDKLNYYDGRPITAVALHRELTEDVSAAKLAIPPYYSCDRSDRGTVLIERIPDAKFDGNPSLHMPPSGFIYVVIKVLLKDTVGVPTRVEWEKWLSTNMPLGQAGLQDIEVTYGFETNSSFVYFVRMPLEIWHWLPSRKAYEFVDIAKPGGKLTQQLSPLMELNEEDGSQGGGSDGHVCSSRGFPYLCKSPQ